VKHPYAAANKSISADESKTASLWGRFFVPTPHPATTASGSIYGIRPRTKHLKINKNIGLLQNNIKYIKIYFLKENDINRK
jgi:hypothetical protein